MSLKKVVMRHQTTGVGRYVIGPGPRIKLAPREGEERG